MTQQKQTKSADKPVHAANALPKTAATTLTPIELQAIAGAGASRKMAQIILF